MKVKIACFSDTHTKHQDVVIPECDIAIFAGDASNRGSMYDIIPFMEWYNKQYQATRKIWIAGNHDVTLDRKRTGETKYPEWFENAIRVYENIHYLEHNSINLFGLNIFGSPYTPEFYPEYWGFNVKRGPNIRAYWNSIPDNTDVLVVHGPMRGTLDWVSMEYNRVEYPAGHVGCDDLRDRVYQLKQLKLFTFGHIHSNTGILYLPIGDKELVCVNAAVVDQKYNFKHQPQIIELDV